MSAIFSRDVFSIAAFIIGKRAWAASPHLPKTDNLDARLQAFEGGTSPLAATIQFPRARDVP